MAIYQSYDDAFKRGFEKLMNMNNKDVLKKNMLFISMFVLLYEYFCDTFIERVKNKLCGFIGIPEEELIETDEYIEKIKTRKINGEKNKLLSTIQWFVDEKAITMDEYDVFFKSRAKRNQYVHEMENCLPDSNASDIQLFKELISLYKKMNQWWNDTCDNLGDKVIRISIVDIMLGTLFSDTDIRSMFE